MRKVFLDIGAGEGTSAEYMQGKGFEIYSFECDINNIHKIQQNKIKTNLIPAAAWSSQGMEDYYPGTVSGAGTLYSRKKTGGVDKKNYYEVATVDLAKFITDNFKKEDYIVIKLNCEGSEYELIPYLKYRGLIPWINEWFVNWHWKKIVLSEEKHKEVVNMIPESKPWRPC